MKSFHQALTTLPSKVWPHGRLCDACEKLDLDVLFCDETSQQYIGKISKYQHPDCPFCGLISDAVLRAWGAAERHRAEGCELLIQSRSPLSVIEDGHTRHPQPRLLLATDQEPPMFHHNKAPQRQVDRVKSGFIIAEIESLPHYDSENNYLPRREIGKYVDIALVKDWLNECQNHQHSEGSVGESVGSDLFQPQFPFRLVDVDRECIIEKVERCEYVALSYVWGDTPTLSTSSSHGINDQDEIPILETLRGNIEDMKVDKSLSKLGTESTLSGRIPATVRDAMEFTRRIGMRYMWVDTLCIVQDDDDEKKRLITQMGDIYNSAVVTIIAAAGSNADAGLNGISPRTGRPLNPVTISIDPDETVLNLSVSLSSLCEEVRRETWNSRGWTFQEQSLSQRCLYFTSDEVFFNCSECQRREGYDYAEKRKMANKEVEITIRTGPPWWNRNLRRDLDPTPYHYLGGTSVGQMDAQAYQTAVQEYTQKSLKYPHDIFNAFEGIFNKFERFGNETTEKLSIRQAQAIPSHLLCRAMLWFPLPGVEKRRLGGEDAGRQGIPYEQLSSWSWASWAGPVEFVFADNHWLPRKISQAPVKRVPLHLSMFCWYYGGLERRFFLGGAWKSVYEDLDDDSTKQTFLELARSRHYLERRVGIDVKSLLEGSSRSEVELRESLQCGELGFFAPHVAARKFEVMVAPGHLYGNLDLSGHKGEFRFDGGDEPIDELVPIVSADTLTKNRDTQSILLGLTTRGGISKRVGVGYIYYSNANIPKPKWEYRFFRVR